MDFLDFKVAFRGCVSLLPLLLGSTELPVPREVLGREVLEEKELGALLVLRIRNESSVSEIIEVFDKPETEGVYAAVELLLVVHLSKLPYFA